jgi:hypothetical protein
MKTVPIAALVALLAVAPSALAKKAATPAPAMKADCEKVKMKWDAKAGKDHKGACVAETAATPATISK